MKSPLKKSIGEVVTDYGARVMKVFKKGLLQRSLFDFYGDVKADKLRVKESSSVPATPVDGDGGVMYTKSADGKLYYKSNEVAEVELSATSVTTFVIEDGDGTEVTLTQGREIKFVEGTGIDIDFTDVSTGSDADPYDITISSDLEGTEVKSTGESGGSKFLREDGDGTCSWQTPTDTNTTYSEATGSAEGLMSIAHHDKLDGIETGADVTDTTNVTAAGALMDSELTDLAGIKSLNTSTLVNLSGTQTITGGKTFERGVILDGDKSVTAGSDGVTLHIDSQDITDNSTSGSGTATTFAQVVIENSRLLATNSSVTTTNAYTVYIKGAPLAHTNQTITNAYSLYVAGGNSHFEGTLSCDDLDITGSSNALTINSTTGNVAINASSTDADCIIRVADNSTAGTNVIGLVATGDDSIIRNDEGNFKVKMANNATTTLDLDQSGNLEVSGKITTTHDYHATTFENQIADDVGTGKILKYSPGANDTLNGSEIYFLHTDGTWDQADADDVATGASQMLGVGLAGSSQTVGVLIEGFIRIASTEILNTPGSGAVDGLPLYVSTTPGHFDFTAPSGTADFVRIVGYAIDDNGGDVLVYFNPDKTWVEIA